MEKKKNKKKIFLKMKNKFPLLFISFIIFLGLINCNKNKIDKFIYSKFPKKKLQNITIIDKIKFQNHYNCLIQLEKINKHGYTIKSITNIFITKNKNNIIQIDYNPHNISSIKWEYYPSKHFDIFYLKGRFKKSKYTNKKKHFIFSYYGYLFQDIKELERYIKILESFFNKKVNKKIIIYLLNPFKGQIKNATEKQFNKFLLSQTDKINFIEAHDYEKVSLNKINLQENIIYSKSIFCFWEILELFNYNNNFSPLLILTIGLSEYFKYKLNNESFNFQIESSFINFDCKNYINCHTFYKEKIIIFISNIIKKYGKKKFLKFYKNSTYNNYEKLFLELFNVPIDRQI